jgi:hypothetical protein
MLTKGRPWPENRLKLLIKRVYQHIYNGIIDAGSACSFET